MLRIPLALLACAMAALVVGATHTPRGRCTSDGEIAAGIVELTGGDASTTAYVDDRNYLFGNGVWIYLEWNGIHTARLPGAYAAATEDPATGVTAHNLQRGGCGLFFHNVECGMDPCVDDPNNWYDMLVF